LNMGGISVVGEKTACGPNCCPPHSQVFPIGHGPRSKEPSGVARANGRSCCICVRCQQYRWSTRVSVCGDWRCRSERARKVLGRSEFGSRYSVLRIFQHEIRPPKRLLCFDCDSCERADKRGCWAAYSWKSGVVDSVALPSFRNHRLVDCQGRAAREISNSW
jgi:hypothetical protein